MNRSVGSAHTSHRKHCAWYAPRLFPGATRYEPEIDPPQPRHVGGFASPFAGSPDARRWPLGTGDGEARRDTPSRPLEPPRERGAGGSSRGAVPTITPGGRQGWQARLDDWGGCVRSPEKRASPVVFTSTRAEGGAPMTRRYVDFAWSIDDVTRDYRVGTSRV